MKTRMLVVLALVMLVLNVSVVGEAFAYQGMTEQKVIINVLPKLELEDIDAPLSGQEGFEAGADAGGGADVAASPLVFLLMLAGLLAVLVLLARRLVARKRLVIVVPVAVVLVSILASVLLPRPVSLAADVTNPLVAATPETLEYTIPAGSSGSRAFSLRAETSPTTPGYTLSAIADNDFVNDIFLFARGGDLAEQTKLPNDVVIDADAELETDADAQTDMGAGAQTADSDDSPATSSDAAHEPLLIRSTDNPAPTGDVSNYSLIVEISENLVPGEYVVSVFYFVNTDEGESFIFNIDTRMAEATATTFAIPTSGYVGQNFVHDYSWYVDWGDGSAMEQVSGAASATSAGVPHTYSTPGEYQIKIYPAGRAVAGWMNAFGFYDSTAGANAQSNKDKFKSVVSSLTNAMRTSGSTYRFAYMFFGARNATEIQPYLFFDIDTANSHTMANMFNSTFSGFASNSTSAEIPAILFSNINTESAVDMSGMFTATFFNFANRSVSATIPAGLFNSVNTAATTNISNMFRDTFFGHAAASRSGTIPAGLFDSVSVARKASANDLFAGTFYMYAMDSTVGTIPAGLFASIDTTNASSILGMFSGTFSNYARASTEGVIPAGLFGSINTSNIADTSYLFNGTFSGYATNSNTTIPAGLFATINTANAINLNSTFASTFASFANNSTAATIPAGLFAAVNLSKATNVSNLFRDTFSNYAGLSTVATIPAGLFDTINTVRVQNVANMFSGTFYFYGHAAPSTVIPANLFTAISLAAATDVTQMFYRTFDSAAYESTASTDINTIWGEANFAGKVTPSNASSFFNSTFSNVRNLTGTAQTFINNKLGGIVPSSPAYTFATTAIIDKTIVAANWQTGETQ